MKKNLLFTGLLLAALPLCAQDGPTSHPTDPYVIFSQDFEFEGDGFDAWQTQIIDSIKGVQYYIHERETEPGNQIGTNAKPWTKRDEWVKGPVRDTTLYLRNDVMTADNDDDRKAFGGDTWNIVNDFGSEAGDKRQQQLDKYAVQGGKKYFKYVSLDTLSAPTNMAWGTSGYGGPGAHLAARYRRNLFVRGIPVEDTTSYRFTAYVYTHKDGEKAARKPTFYVDVMRGHFASEKPFSMGIESDASTYKYNASFEKTVEFDAASSEDAVYKEDNWSKVVFMTYYINDSIADDYVFVNGYYWDDEWDWPACEENNNKHLAYHVQPDKYFVRLGFASDSTTFGVDNISLTKSTIGGCEYNNDMLRVDFGYDTNLKELCKKEKERVNIAALELPGQYFEVWGCLDKENDEWEKVDIASAEYHDDGYMYMWTDIDEATGEAFDFSYYDSVLVSFTNPTDERMRLCYGSSLFPRAWDTAWIKSGRPVMNFTNEVATPNPNVGKDVFSMKTLPPVFQGGKTHELGSFQLPGNTKSFEFKFSKRIAIDNAAGESTAATALMLVEKGGKQEYWIPTQSNDSTTTFARQEKDIKANGELDGDYQFKIVQVYGASQKFPATGNTKRGDDVSFAYSFGDQPSTEGLVVKVTFDAQKASSASKEIGLAGFSMARCAQQITEFKEGGVFTKALTFGILSQGPGAKDGDATCAKLYYTFDISEPADYDFQLILSLYSGTDKHLDVKVLDADGKKISDVEPIIIAQTKKFKDGEKVTAVDTLAFTVSGMAAGKYTLEFSQPDSHDDDYGGWVKYNDAFNLHSLAIVKNGCEIPFMSIGYPYTSAFAIAQRNLNEVLASITDTVMNKYGGTAYTEGNATVTEYKDFNSGKDVTAPSAWTAATNALNAAYNAIKDRNALVDEMYAQRNMLTDTLAAFAAKDHEGMNTYKASVADMAKYASLVPSGATDDSIKAITELYKKDADLMAKHAAAIDAFNAAMTVADDSIKSKTAVETFDEYAALQAAYGIANAVDYDNEPVDTIAKRKEALVFAISNYVYAFLADEFNRAYIADLAALPGLDLSTSASDIATMLENREYAKLEAIYRNSIKARLYSEIVDGTVGDSVPLNALIKNNKLYATALIRERMDIKIPESAGQIKSAADGCNIVHTRHQHNENGNQPIWIMVLDNDFTNLFPAWTVRSVSQNNGGNQMATPDRQGYANFKAGKTFFDGNLSIDWNTKAELSTRVEDLPAGIFEVGADFASNGESKLVVNKTEKKVNNTAFVSVAGVQDTADIKVTLVSGNGWSTLDDFALIFREADPDANYEELRDAAIGEVTSVLTFDDAADEAEAQYEYFTLDAIKTDAPEGIVLRKNIATGEVEKVLFK